MDSNGSLGWSPVVIVGASATVVIERALAATHRHDIQVALEGNEPVVAFLSTLTADGVGDLPRFAYVGREGAAVRILLRGNLVAVVRNADGSEADVAAGAVSTWTEVLRSDCVDVALRSDGELVTVVSYGVPVVSPLLPPGDTSPEVEDHGEPAEALHQVSIEETILPAPEVGLVPSAGSASDAEREPVEELAPTSSVAVPPAMVPSEDEVDLSHLFETRHVGVEAAAIRAEIASPDPAAPGKELSLADLPPPTGPPVGAPVASNPPEAPPVGLADLPPPAGAPIAATPPPALIAGVPGVLSAPGASPAVEAGIPDVQGDHDGFTISPAELAALRGGTTFAGSFRPSGPTGPQLQAVACPSGHLNPPQAERCRGCSAAIVDRSIRVVSRPSLGHLSFDGGTVVDIDRPLLIGRKPTAEGVADDAEVPGLVVLPDPDGSLSRVHAEVRIEGWEVLVVDRNSTNGTFVEIPGQLPVMLRPMEPCLISPGTRITLADVATCAFRTGPR